MVKVEQIWLWPNLEMIIFWDGGSRSLLVDWFKIIASYLCKLYKVKPLINFLIIRVRERIKQTTFLIWRQLSNFKWWSPFFSDHGQSHNHFVLPMIALPTSLSASQQRGFRVLINFTQRRSWHHWQAYVAWRALCLLKKMCENLQMTGPRHRGVVSVRLIKE